MTNFYIFEHYIKTDHNLKLIGNDAQLDAHARARSKIGAQRSLFRGSRAPSVYRPSSHQNSRIERLFFDTKIVYFIEICDNFVSKFFK